MNELLIVDNSRAALVALKYQLDQLFFVRTALSVSEAFKSIEATMPDCILTDYEFPDTDAPTFCRQLKQNERFKHIPIVVLTSMTDSEYLLNVIDAGADDFIAKECDIRLIKSKITAMMRIKRFQDELTRLKRFEGVKQIISTYNHDFNNPLTIAIGNLNWLRKNHVGDDQLTRIGRLSDALGRMLELVKKIRDLRDYVDASFASDEIIVKVNESVRLTTKAE